MALRCPACGTSSSDDSAFCSRCGARLAPPADPLIGRVIAARYRVVELVGEGGMGRVYAAEQNLGAHLRRVAVKVLLPQYASDPVISSRFSREVGLASQLEHPHTVRVYDSGRTESGELFVVMELLAGETVATALSRGPLPLHRALRILGQVSSSLADAHRRGIVHRDIKPDNIFLTRIAEGDDFAKILDFGIAKHHAAGGSAQLTHVGEVLGTPPYMSPEHFGAGEIDARSDIYSLGVVAFEMLTGQLPFTADGLMQWAAVHASARPASFDATAAGRTVPLPVRAAIEHALAKRPVDRPQTVERFYAELAGDQVRLSDVSWLPPTRSQAALPAAPSVPTAPATGTIVALPPQRLATAPSAPSPAHPVVSSTNRAVDYAPPRSSLPGWAIAVIATLSGGIVVAGIFVYLAGVGGAKSTPVVPSITEPSVEPVEPTHTATNLASVVPVPTEPPPPKDPRTVTLQALDAIVREIGLARADGYDPKHALVINAKIGEIVADPAFTTSPQLGPLLDAFPSGLVAQGNKFAIACSPEEMKKDPGDPPEHSENILKLVEKIRPLREALP